MIRLALAVLMSFPALAAAEAVWRRDPPPTGPLVEGPKTLIRPGSQQPACLEVTLREYRTPFRLHALIQPQGGPVGWCDAGSLICYAPPPARAPVSMVRWDKGRLSTATKVRYCATFENMGRVPAQVWLARPKP